MQVHEYAICDAVKSSDGDFFVAVMGVFCPEEKAANYSLNYIKPGVFGARPSFYISLKGDNGREVDCWLLTDFPLDVSETICTEGVLIKDWETKIDLNMTVTIKGAVDA